MEWNEQDFLQKYRGMEKYLTEGRKYYDLFKALLPKTELLEKIRQKMIEKALTLRFYKN